MNSMSTTSIIAVDFDGTIVDHQYPRIGKTVPLALTWLLRFQVLGCRIILWTMRSDREDEEQNTLTDAVNLLESNGIKLYGVNENPDQSSWTSSPKAYAEVYIDDAVFGCPRIKLKGFEHQCVDWSVVGPALWLKFTGTRAEDLAFAKDGTAYGTRPRREVFHSKDNPS